MAAETVHFKTKKHLLSLKGCLKFRKYNFEVNLKMTSLAEAIWDPINPQELPLPGALLLSHCLGLNGKYLMSWHFRAMKRILILAVVWESGKIKLS